LCSNVVIEGTPAFACVPSENTIPAAGKVTVPVNVGELIGAFAARLFVTVVEKLASFPSAVANSFNVFNADGADAIRSATAPVTNAVVAI